MHGTLNTLRHVVGPRLIQELTSWAQNAGTRAGYGLERAICTRLTQTSIWARVAHITRTALYTRTSHQGVGIGCTSQAFNIVNEIFVVAHGAHFAC